MSQWQRVCYLCQSNQTFQQRLGELYARINVIPIKIRILQSAWLESQDWLIDTNSEDGLRQADSLYNVLITLILESIERLKIEQPYERTMELEIILSNLRKTFDNESKLFVETIRQCLNEERDLIEQFSSEIDEDQAGYVVPRRAQENYELMQKLEAVRRRIDEAGVLITEVDRQQEAFLVEYKNKHAIMNQLQTNPSYTGYNRAQATTEYEKHHEETKQLAQLNLDRRNEMAAIQIKVAIDLARLIKLIWEDILQWHQQERKIITGLTTSLDGALDVLDKLCNVGGELLHRMIGQVENALAVCNKVFYQADPKKRDLEKVLQELKEDYLPSYLRRAFVVEQNVPERILKISGNKSVNFSMSVRLLGGMSLGVGFSKPTVKMSVFYETDVPRTDTFTSGMCEIENSNERAFVLNTSCTAHFHSVRLKSFRRPNLMRHSGGSSSEELVTEQKYAIVFFTTISICEQDFHIKVVSLPLIFISQTSQEIMAKGTLIWDAAFSEEMREPYKYREQVRWVEVAAVLNALFTTHTGRGLNEDHQRYLAKMAFKTERDDVSDFGAYPISEKQVIKDKLDARDFSFWKWFWACMNLAKEYIRQEWNDGLIYGFISKEDAREKLQHHECGTFLLRFSEGNIEPCQKANVCGFLTLAVLEKDPATGNKRLFHVKEYLESKEIQSKKGLGVILDAMEVIDYDRRPQKKKLLKYLWPDTNRPFQDRFKIVKPDPKGTYPYTSAKIIIEIFLGSQQPAGGGWSGTERRIQGSMESVNQDVMGVYESGVTSPSMSATSDDVHMEDLIDSMQRSSGTRRPVMPVIPMISNASTVQNGGGEVAGSSEDEPILAPTISPDAANTNDIIYDINSGEFFMSN